MRTPEQTAADAIFAMMPDGFWQAPHRAAVEAAIAAAFEGERAQAAGLRRMLNHQHAKHSETLSVYFEQDGKPIDFATDLGEAYDESELAQRTIEALTDGPAEALAREKELRAKNSCCASSAMQ